MSGTVRRTPLYPAHAALKARLVDFHGWEMPIQYAGIVEEHEAVRSRVGLFDISHMGRIRVRGAARRAYLQRLLTVDVDKIKPGRCKYSFFLNERGTVIDDLILYAGGPDDMIVLNASNREKDLEWMRAHLLPGVDLVDETFDVSLLALQGPRSLETVKRVLDLDPSPLKYYTFGEFGGRMLSRTGYTGEDGFEIFVPTPEIRKIWDRFIEAQIAPIGLGARDTLRTEAAMPLYGNDIDDTTTPLEAGLDFAVDLAKPEFIGQAALKKAGPPSRKLTGLVLDSKRVPRPGMDLVLGGAAAGKVTSGTWSPSLGKSIAMGYLPAGTPAGTPVEVDVRGKREPARTAPLPFYRREKS